MGFFTKTCRKCGHTVHRTRAKRVSVRNVALDLSSHTTHWYCEGCAPDYDEIEIWPSRKSYYRTVRELVDVEDT